MSTNSVGLMCSLKDGSSEDVSDGQFTLGEFYDAVPDFLNGSEEEGYRILRNVFSFSANLLDKGHPP